MPQFKPFKGIRPVREIAGFFSTISVDAYSPEQLEHELNSNPQSFLHIIKPTWDDPAEPIAHRHRKVRENFRAYIDSESAETDKASFYIYQISKPNKENVRGLIGLVNMDDYEKGTIKKHEETLTKRVERFADYLQNVHFHAEPVLLTYHHNQRIDLLMDVEMKRLPALSFKDREENLHQLWVVENRLNLQQFKDSVERNESLYIADGHHRMESSFVYTQKIREQQKNTAGTEPYNYTLAMLVSDRELLIKDYNRLVRDLNGHSKEEFLSLLKQKFDIVERGETPFFPSKKHHIGMYLDGNFYGLFVKKEILTEKGLSELDTYLLEEFVLKPVLNIHDSRNDERIDFLRGTGNAEGIKELKNKVDTEGFKAGFFFYPVNPVDLQMIADLGLQMPPKSTYIEPKPLSGLTIFDLQE